MNILEKKEEKYINEFLPHMKHVLIMLCKMVNANVNEINFNQYDWFMEYTWDVATQKQFEDWMTEYLYNTASARREIMAFPRKNKKKCRDVAHHFAMWYGWKTNYPKDKNE